MTTRLPAEWEPQSGIMLTWPHDRSDWLPILADADNVFTHIATAVSRRENVLIVARDDQHRKHILSQLTTADAEHSRIRFALAASDDSWARDHGPITTLEEGKPVLLDFQFNGWGAKHPFEMDNQITGMLNQQGCFRFPVRHMDFILEGGSIESDGDGTLLTSNCLLTGSRNRGYSKSRIEQCLSAALGIRQFHWLSHGELRGDDTDAHIDTLARFVSPNQIAYVQCNDPKDEHYAGLRQMENELAALRDRNNKPYKLIPLPLPDPVYDDKGHRLPATYANFLIINDAVLVPVYGQDRDRDAVTVLQNCFPSREIVAIDCLTLIKQSGSLHCVTMQFPAGVLI